ncbi:MAG TPA: peptidylprolyl isomerase [Solirubrobacteraceae bacterium]|jgi:peptidyl-prolyl cis-trans isomerase B (cyclophilin B)
MLRRLLPALLACFALALAACGDDEETVGDRPTTEGLQSETSGTVTGAEEEPKPVEPASGCRKVKEPKPKSAKLEKPKDRLDAGKTWIAVMKTSCGTLEITLDVKENPKTASSFAHMVREGFYDNLLFHRVVPGFVVQGGDPKGTGQGGPGYSVVEAPPRSEKYKPGTVAMAKTELEDPGTSGSQFFIVTGTDIPLEPLYAVVGRVTKGDKVVDLLANVPNDPADNRPTEPVVIEKVTLRSE